MTPSKSQLRLIIDAIPVMAWSGRSDGSVEFLNRQWLDYTGFSLDEALAGGWKAAVHPDDLDRLTEKWRALLGSGQAGEIEARVRRHDGEYRWFLFRAEPARDDHGDTIRWYGTNTDIEERKRAESLLAAEKRTLEMIASGALLTDILENLCDSIDTQVPNLISTVMLMIWHAQRLCPAPGRVPKGW